MYSLTCVYPMGECWERRYGAYGVCEVQRLTRLIRPEGLHTADRLVGSACISRLYDESRAAWGDRLSSARRIHRLAISQCSRARGALLCVSLSLSLLSACNTSTQTQNVCLVYTVQCSLLRAGEWASCVPSPATSAAASAWALRPSRHLASDLWSRATAFHSAFSAHRVTCSPIISHQSFHREHSSAALFALVFGTCSRTQTQRNATRAHLCEPIASQSESRNSQLVTNAPEPDTDNVCASAPVRVLGAAPPSRPARRVRAAAVAAARRRASRSRPLAGERERVPRGARVQPAEQRSRCALLSFSTPLHSSPATHTHTQVKSVSEWSHTHTHTHTHTKVRSISEWNARVRGPEEHSRAEIPSQSQIRLYLYYSVHLLTVSQESSLDSGFLFSLRTAWARVAKCQCVGASVILVLQYLLRVQHSSISIRVCIRTCTCTVLVACIHLRNLQVTTAASRDSSRIASETRSQW